MKFEYDIILTVDLKESQSYRKYNFKAKFYSPLTPGMDLCFGNNLTKFYSANIERIVKMPDTLAIVQARGALNELKEFSILEKFISTYKDFIDVTPPFLERISIR